MRDGHGLPPQVDSIDTKWPKSDHKMSSKWSKSFLKVVQKCPQSGPKVSPNTDLLIPDRMDQCFHSFFLSFFGSINYDKPNEMDCNNVRVINNANVYLTMSDEGLTEFLFLSPFHSTEVCRSNRQHLLLQFCADVGTKAGKGLWWGSGQSSGDLQQAGGRGMFKACGGFSAKQGQSQLSNEHNEAFK